MCKHCIQNPFLYSVEFEDLNVLVERFSKELNRSYDRIDNAYDDDDDDDYDAYDDDDDCGEGSGFEFKLNGSFDLVFVLDKSGSISNSDFNRSLQFVKTLVNTFSRKYHDVRFSVVTYSKKPELVSDSHRNPDGNRTHSDSGLFFCRSELKKLLRNVRRGTYGPTATRRALDLVRDNHLLKNRHCYSCTPPTPRPPGKDIYTYPCASCVKSTSRSEMCASTLLFLITDGKSNWAGDPRLAAKCLKDNGVEIFSVGVTSHINIDELRDIASEPLHTHLYLIQSFDDAVKLVTLAKKRFK